jgi:hypothetical protein
MKTIEQIREVPSPNVTVNHPNAFYPINDHSLWGPKALGYSCRVVHGVYIFDTLNQNVLSCVSQAFDAAFRTYQNDMYPVGVSGFKNPEGRIGSNRFCTMSSILADFFTNIIFDSEMLDAHAEYGNFLKVSKYFRAMKYTSGGEHFPHYDSDFVVGRKRELLTRMSLVAYGNDCETGEIAFIRDGHDDGSRQDWERQANDSEIFLKIAPKVGRIVVFDHKICHTVLPYIDKEGERRILRGDLIFEKF